MNSLLKHNKITFSILFLCLCASTLWAADPECIVPNDTTIFQCSPSLVSLPVECVDADGDLVSGPDIVSVPAVGTIVGGNWEYTPTGNEVINEVINVTIQCVDALGGLCESSFIVTFVINSPPDSPVCPPDSSHFTCDIFEPITIDGFSCTDPDNNIDSMIVVIGVDTLDLVGSSISFVPKDGDNILKYICIDSCGEKDSCQTIVDVIENSSPTINYNPSPSNDTLDLFLCAGDSYELFYDVTDVDSNIKSEALKAGSPGTIDTALNRIQFIPILSSVYREIIVVTDSCDVVDEDTIFVNVTINSPPDIIFGSDQNIDLCEPIPICVSYIVTDNDPLDLITETLIFDHPTATIDTVENEICFTPDINGEYTIQVQATDNCGLSDIDDIIITVNLNEPPVADSTDPDNIFICQDTTITHVFTAVDITYPTLTWLSLTNDVVISIDGEMLLMVDTSGTYIVTAEVTDGCDAKDTISHVFIITRNSAPIPNTYPVIDTFICVPIEICHQFEATDPDIPIGDELSWIPNGIQDGTFTPATAEWCFTPDESRTYQLSVTVEDLCGASNVTEAIYHVTINSPPDINFGSDQNIDLCEPTPICVKYAVTDNDPLDLITETLLFDHPTATIDTVENEICFTPGINGEYTIQVQATDNCGLSDIDDIIITVNLNEPPVADSTDPDEIFICQDTTITHLFTALDITFPTLTWLPLTNDVEINVDGEMILLVDTSGTYIVTAEVSDGCDAKDTVSQVFIITRNSAPSVSFNPHPVNDTFDLFLCTDDFYELNYVATDIDNNIESEVLISQSGSTIDTEINLIQFTPTMSGIYREIIVVTDSCGIIDEDTLFINVTINSAPTCIVKDTIIELADSLVFIRVPVGCSDVDFEDGFQSKPDIGLYGPNIIGDIVLEGSNYFWEYYVHDDDSLDVAIICTDSCGAFCVDSFKVIINVNDSPTFTIKRNGTTSFTSDTTYVRPNQELELWVTVEDQDANLDTVFSINTDLSSLTPIVTFSWDEETNYTDSISGILWILPNSEHIDNVYPVTFTARDNCDVFVDTTIYINILPVTNLEFAFDPDSSTFTDFHENRETILYYRAVDEIHPSDLITITAETLPAGAIFQSTQGNPTHATVTWTPGFCDHDQLGSSVAISLRAVNDSGDVLVSDGFDLLDGGNHKPIIIVDNQWTLTEEIPDTLIITRTDTDGECVGAPFPTYNLLSISDNPNSGEIPELLISNDTAFVIWSPFDGDRGDYILTIEVDDQVDAKDTTTVDVTVLATYNKTPEFQSLQTNASLSVNNPDGSITLTNYEDDQFYFEITFLDSNVLDTITIVSNFDELYNCNKTGWNWDLLVVDTNYSIGRFTWTPSDTDAADFNMSFFALDGDTVSEIKNVNLHIIDQSNSPPDLFCESGSFRVVENSTLSFDLWATDIDSDDTLFKFTSLPRPPVWGNGSLTPFDVLTDSATFTWTPDYCIAMNDSIEYEIIFMATDNDSLSDDTTFSIWVIDAGNELAQIGIPSWDSISIAGYQASIPLTLTASDRDCDRIRFNGFKTSVANAIIAIIPDAADSIFNNDTLSLNIFISPNTEGLFCAILYIESDHNGIDWALSDSLELTIYVGDQVPPSGDFEPIIAGECIDDICSPVISRVEFSDNGSGIDSVYISYRQGNHVVSSQTKILIPEYNVEIFSITDTIPEELFTIYGLEVIYQSFDGANPPNSSYDTIDFNYDYHYDYSPTNAPYGRVDNFIPPTLRTLFYNDFSEGSAELNSWTLFSIPTIIDSVYLRLDSLFKYDINNFANNETDYGWRIYKRSLWETGQSSGVYNMVSINEPLEHNHAYFYRRLDNNSVDERNERLYIPHGMVKNLNEVNFDNIINYSNKQVWRFIGNPFPFPIRLDNLFSPSSIYRNGINSFYVWNWETQSWIRLPATGQDTKFNILQPYSGFICWPFDPGNAHLVIDPNWVYEDGKNIPTTKNLVLGNKFTIEMDILSNGLTDNLQFGFKDDANDFAGWEDHFKFTSSFENSFIKFGINNFDWSTNAGIYSGDFRPYPTEGENWPLMIYSSNIDDGSLVIFNWDIKDKLNSEYEIWLIDKLTDNHINMRELSSCSFKQVTDIEDERFEVIIGTEYFLENYLSHSSGLIPVTFKLHQNYPNPFNPTTTIKFDLPNSGEVELTVFNVLGQEVKKIFNGVMIKGEHTLQWNGADFNGTPVTSGTYFYRLKTNEQIQTKKMILIR